MEQRQDDVVDVTLVHSEMVDAADAEQDAMGVGHQHALGRPGRAGRVHDGRDVRRPRHRPGVTLPVAPVAEPAVTPWGFIPHCRGQFGVAREKDGAEDRHLAREVHDPIQQDRRRDHESRPGIAELVGQEGALQLGVEDNEGCAEPPKSEPGPNDVESIVQEHGHTIARGYAQATKVLGHAVRLVVGLAVGQRFAVDDADEGLVRPLACVVGQDLGIEPALRGLDRGIHRRSQARS